MKRTLARWEPFADFPRLPRDMFSWLELPEAFRSEWSPRSEVIEKDDKVIIRAELPGVDRENVSVEVADSTLTISGEKTSELKEEDGKHTKTERFYGSFERMYVLPEGTDAENIAASMKNGVLEVVIPRLPAKISEAKKIMVQGD